MMKSKFILLLLMSLIFSGCVTQKEEVAPVVELTPYQIAMNKANEAIIKRDWEGAYKILSEADKDVIDLEVHENLQLKIAVVLYEMGNYSAALAELAPMPEVVGTLNDCKKLFIAARILKRMNSKPEYIESLMEVALDNSIDENGTLEFKAPAYVELGKVYIENGKNSRAIKCYEYASDLYKMLGNKKDEKICRNIMEYLQ